MPELRERVSRAAERVWLAAPFLSVQVADDLVKSAAGKSLDLRLVTAVNSRAVASGSLSPAGLSKLLKAGFEIRSIPNIHAKVALVDTSWGLISSGNLTLAGADGGNVEVGVELGPTERRDLETEFERWWKHGTAVTTSALAPFETVWATSPVIATKNFPRNLGTPLRSTKARKHSRSGSDQSDRTDSGFWIKAMYNETREDAGEWWRELTWLSAVHTFRGKTPVDRPSYKPGDMLLIYVKGPRKIPAIVKVISEPRFDREFVNRETGSRDGDRWGWVSEVEVIRAVALHDGVTLEQLAVSGRGLQNGHVRISEEQFSIAADLLG